MKSLCLTHVFVSLMLLLILTTPQLASAQQTRYERAYLDELMEQYLDAMIAHDPSGLPLAHNFKYTENGQQMELGEGMWGPETARGDYALHFADLEKGAAGFFGVIIENGNPQFVNIRLKVVDGLLTESELLVWRYNPAEFGDASALEVRPIFNQALAPSERRSRSELIRITNSYFEGIQSNTADIIPFHPECKRYENGIGTANNPDAESDVHRMKAADQWDTGFSIFVTETRERRFTIVDEERGLVFATVFFDHAGVHQGLPAPFDVPLTWEIGELFKIVDGQIVQIEAMQIFAPYKMDSGW